MSDYKPEPCPPNLDADGRSLWEQCEWIISGGKIATAAELQMQALYIRRELRQESRANAAVDLLKRVVVASHLRQHASLTGPVFEKCRQCFCGEWHKFVERSEHERQEKDEAAAV